MGQAFFITGTDTGVGKTVVSATLCALSQRAGQTVIYYKPIQTGTPVGLPPEDPAWVQNVVPSLRVENRYCFVPPVTPLVADPQGIIDFALIQDDITRYQAQCDVLIVEGAGGLMVPTTRDAVMLDLIDALGLPVVLVTRPNLGTLNHTLLSVDALTQREISISAMVMTPTPSQEAVAEVSVIQVLQGFLPCAIPIATLDSVSTFSAEALCAAWQGDLLTAPGKDICLPVA